MPLPIEIIGLNRPDITLVWDDEGHQGTWAVRDIRLRCACAHCIDEMTGRPLLDPARVPEEVTIRGIELAGTYGMRIDFSDGHNTGIFRFQDLFDACTCDICRARRGAGT
jgi:ATP-binding protein involved in chromosome partitioning